MKSVADKKWIAIAVVVVFAFVLFLLIMPGDGKYRAESTVLISSYTNALATKAFEKQAMRSIPGVIRLKVSRPPPPNSNRRLAMTITVVAVDSTPEDARVAANAAGLRLCQLLASDYGVNGQLVNQANSARGYSYFRDGLEPALARLFKP